MGEPMAKRPAAAGEPAAKRPRAADGAVAASHGTPIAARAMLHYQKEVEGKRVGRYIDSKDTGELADQHEEREVALGDARALVPAATLDSRCFELRNHPTAVSNFRDDEEIRRVYFEEMEALVKATTGAERVIVFDHTVRDTGAGGSLNVKAGEAGSAVIRVHTDYSDDSGPRRVQTLAEQGGYTGVKLSEEDKKDILSRDFCIVNVWRNIKPEPVQSKPLAVLEPAGLDKRDFLRYEMQFPDRVGENYALKYNSAHRWYFYPRMEKDECLVFKTWESRTDRPRYCFHTAFEALDQAPDAPPRASIEIRTVAIMPRRTAL